MIRIAVGRCKVTFRGSFKRRAKEVNELEENKVSLSMRGFKEHLFFLEERRAKEVNELEENKVSFIMRGG